MVKTDIETQVNALVDSIAEDAVREEFEVIMQDYTGLISPQLCKTLKTVFQAGVGIGALKALARIAGVK